MCITRDTSITEQIAELLRESFSAATTGTVAFRRTRATLPFAFLACSSIGTGGVAVGSARYGVDVFATKARVGILSAALDRFAWRSGWD